MTQVQRPSDEAAVSARGLTRTFGSGATAVRALDDLSLEVHRGELVVLLGPSGCGKTTLLRSIAGLEVPDAGEIEILGKPVFAAQSTFVPPERRDAAMVFQSYALWPNMTVFDNVAYPLQTRKETRSETSRRVSEALDTVGCLHLKDRSPHQISGGQQQRVALARAIVANRGLILFDEPLSNVDAKVRERLRIELLTLQRQLGFAGVYVTHDQTEAMVVASRIAVMERGRIVQVGTPQDVYTRPVTRYVADFIGTANFLDAVVRGTEGDDAIVETAFGLVRVRVHDPDLARPGRSVELLFRPEHVTFQGPDAQAGAWRCTVEASMYLGPNYEHVLRLGDQQILAWSAGPIQSNGSGPLWIRIDESQAHVVPAAADELERVA